MRRARFIRAIAAAIFVISAPLLAFGASSKEATVIISLRVAKDGTVKEVKLDQSSGYPALDRATLEKARSWRYEPGMIDGQPAEMWFKQHVTFRCKDEADPLAAAADCQ